MMQLTYYNNIFYFKKTNKIAALFLLQIWGEISTIHNK